MLATTVIISSLAFQADINPFQWHFHWWWVCAQAENLVSSEVLRASFPTSAWLSTREDAASYLLMISSFQNLFLSQCPHFSSWCLVTQAKKIDLILDSSLTCTSSFCTCKPCHQNISWIWSPPAPFLTNTLTIIITSLLKSSSARLGLPVSTVVSSKAFLSPSLIFWKLSHGFSAQKKTGGFALAYKAWHRLPSCHLSDFISCCFPPLLFPLQIPWPPCCPAGLFLAGLCL